MKCPAELMKWCVVGFKSHADGHGRAYSGASNLTVADGEVRYLVDLTIIQYVSKPRCVNRAQRENWFMPFFKGAITQRQPSNEY